MSSPPPMVVPMFIQTPPKATCPECGKPEKIVCKCGHCGHEYKDEECLNPLGLVAVVILLLWLFVTVVVWMIGGDDTLVSVFAAQWKWITSLKVW